MNPTLLKNLEGKIVEVMIARHGRSRNTSGFSGDDIAYIGRLESTDDDNILLNPGVYVGQLFAGNSPVSFYYHGTTESLKEALAKSPIAVVSRESIAGVHQSKYTAEELSLKNKA